MRNPSAPNGRGGPPSTSWRYVRGGRPFSSAANTMRLPVWKEKGPVITIHAPARKFAGLTDSRRKQAQVRGGLGHRHERPLLVGREGPGLSVAKTHGIGPVESTKIGRLTVRRRCFRTLEEKRSTIRGEVGGLRRIEPRDPLAADAPHDRCDDLGASVADQNQGPAFTRNVAHHCIAGRASEATGFPRELDEIEPQSNAGRRVFRRKHDPVPLGRPGEPEEIELRRQCSHVALTVHDTQDPSNRVGREVFGKTERVPLRGESQRAQRAVRRMEDFPDRILDAIAALDDMDHGELLAIRRPVGRRDVLEDLPRNPAGDRSASERPEARVPAKLAAERDRHLPRRGDRQDPGGKKAKRPRLARAHARREDLAGLAVPGGGVNDRLPVRSEARARQEASSEGEGLRAGGGASRSMRFWTRRPVKYVRSATPTSTAAAAARTER